MNKEQKEKLFKENYIDIKYLQGYGCYECVYMGTQYLEENRDKLEKIIIKKINYYKKN